MEFLLVCLCVLFVSLACVYRKWIGWLLEGKLEREEGEKLLHGDSCKEKVNKKL